jgi:hypothetical protein
MGVETILNSFFAVRVVYPFLLVFTLVFAILQKSKILGEDKSQVDALVALSIALIFIAIPYPVDIIISLMPFLAVSLVILLVFMLLYGFIASDNDKGYEASKAVKRSVLGIIVFALLIAVLVATGQWDFIYYSLFVDYGDNTILTNIILLIIILAAIFFVVGPTMKGKSSSE